MANKPFKIGCHCGFSADTPEAFIDHCLVTKHIELPDGVEDGGIMAMLEALSALQQHSTAMAAGEDFELPEGMEIEPVDMDDFMDDPDIPDEVKLEMRQRLDEIKKLEEGK